MPAGKVFNTLYFQSNVLLFESLFPFYTCINFVFISPIYLHISHRLHTDTMKASCRLFYETEIDCMHTLVIFQFFYFFYNVKKSVHKQMHMLHMPLWLLEEVKRLPNELTGFGRLFNLFHAFSLFLYPLKTSRIYVFRGGGGYKETSGMKWVNCGTKLAMGLPNYWYKVKTERCDNYWSWGTSGGKWKNACTFISFKISILNFKTP